MSPSLVSVVVPVYNGEARMTATLDAIAAYLRPRRPFEMIVVDDGSRDRTAALVSEYASRHPEVRLVRLPRNRGKGAAVREGMLGARGALRCFCDVDLPIPIAEIEKLFACLEGASDVAIASRALPQSDMPLKPSPLRRLMSRGFNVIVRTLFALPFRDTQCGFKGFRRDAAREIFSRSRIDGFAFDVELLILARQLGYRVGEVPVRVENPLLSTVSLTAHTGQIVRDLWSICRHLHQGLYAWGAPSGLAPERSTTETVPAAPLLSEHGRTHVSR